MDIFNEAKLLQFRVYLESMLAENKYREFSGKVWHTLKKILIV